MQCQRNEITQNMLHFEPVTLERKQEYDTYIKPYAYRHSEASFANMYIWQPAWDIRMATDGGALYISMDNDLYRPLLAPPFLMDEKESILPYMRRCEEYMYDVYGDFFIKGATVQTINKIKHDCGDRYSFTYDSYNAEYVYNAQDLIDLSGKKYHSKRNHINAFLRKYKSHFEAYKPEYRDACLTIQKDWAKEKQQDARAAQEEYTSIVRALDHYEKLGFQGCVVKIDGEVAAFSFGERICEDTAIIHIEKANAEFDGLFAYINREFVANFWSDCTYINREEDMGVPGIRRAKQSYHPAFMLEKYDVTLNAD